MASLLPRVHIQNFSDADTLEPHWGYASRVKPCVVDAGSCEYLDSVYHSHDVGMTYTFILWAVIGGMLFIWGIGRHLLPSRVPRLRQREGDHEVAPQAGFYRFCRGSSAAVRSYLLSDASRPLFGRVPRLQVLILLVMIGYLTIFTFAGGIVYSTWVTPVKNSPGVYNTRTGLGPFSNRVGVLAYALIPLSVLLSSRESVLSLITGIPYQHFNFFHRWLGYIIYIQSTLHTIGWTVIEAKLYQPQPKVWNGFISQTYMIWGVVAMIFMSFLFFFSTPWGIRVTGYEFFRKAHYIVAMLFVGACWGHWAKLYCWLVASLVVWLVDRGIRLVRTGLLHYGYVDGSTSSMGFQSVKADVKVFPDPINGDVVRLDFKHNHQPWKVGQHFYLCFPENSVWQSHPFTPCTVPSLANTAQQHTYIVRAKKGETKKLAEKAKAKADAYASDKSVQPVGTPIVLSGPYGVSTVSQLQDGSDINVLCVAGGSGITFVLPVLQLLVRLPRVAHSDRKIELIWAVRRKADLLWVQPELDMLHAAVRGLDLTIRIFVTREDDIEGEKTGHSLTKREQTETFVKKEDDKISESEPESSVESSKEAAKPTVRSGSFSVEQATPVSGVNHMVRHPDLNALVTDFVSSTARGPTRVYASGPGGMISDLRAIVALCNSGPKVWKGDERHDVTLVNDDRLER